ncbi:hypothetical protein RQP46_011447 [Phenoliferia psychrophenolica]
MLAQLSLLALASIAAARPVMQMDVMLASISQAVTLPNTTQTDNATWYLQNGNAGACGLYSQDTDKVVGLPLAFYNNTGSVSTFCGAYVVVTNPSNNQTVTSRVADASGSPGLFSMSVASWRAVDGDSSDFETVQWRFANKTETAAAKAALLDPASPSSTVAPVLVATPERIAAPVVATTTYVAPVTTYIPTTTWTPEPTTTWIPEPTTTWTPEPTTTWVAPAPTKAASQSYSGTGTYYYQNGVAGHCGTVNPDSAKIVALSSAMYGDGSNCGRQIAITGNGKTVYGTVADSCPTCVSSGSVDMSSSLFNELASFDAGVVAITWSWA